MRHLTCLVAALACLAGTDSRQIVLQPGHTSSLTGRVVAGDTGEPIAGCRVVATLHPTFTPSRGAADHRELAAVTDADGRYAFEVLPEGEYRLRAELPRERSDYLSIQFGARSPDTLGDVVRLEPGHPASGDFALPPAGAIAGRLLDDRGHPIEGATVMLASDRFDNQGQPRTIVSRRSGTDGRYDVGGLAPGTYRIQAQPPVRPDHDGRALAPTYYPSTTIGEAAQPVTIALGQRVDGIDVQMVREPVLALRGTVTRDDGRSASGAAVRVAFRVGTAIRYRNVRADARGAFAIAPLFAGDYMLTAGSGTPMDQIASRPVRLPAEGDVELRLAPGGSVDGRLVFDGPRVDVPLRIESVPSDRMTAVLTPSSAARVGDNGRFHLAAQFGPRLLRVPDLPAGWWVEAVRLGSRDITNTPTAFASGAAADVEVVIASARTAISGHVDLASARDAVVVVLASDPKLWIRQSTAMASAWPATDGSFEIADVPPGSYKIIAVDKPPRGFVELQRDALEWLSLNGTAVTVTADRPATVNLALTHLP